MNVKLSELQQAKLNNLQNEVKHLSEKECKERLVQVFDNIITHEIMYLKLIRKKWGIGNGNIESIS